MAYTFPIDTDRLAKTLKASTTPLGQKTMAFTLAIERIERGEVDDLTMVMVKRCGRKAQAAVKKNLFVQSMEALRTNS